MMRHRSSHATAYGVSLFLIVLYAAVSFLGAAELWGMNFAKFLPRWWTIVSVLLAALFCVPKFSQTVLVFLERASRSLESSRGIRWLTAVVAIGVFFVLGLVFRVQTYFLGDANLRLSQISHGQLWLGTEPGDFFLHAMATRALLELSSAEVSTAATWSYHFLSVMAGGLFVLGIYRLGRYLQRTQAIAIVALLGASGLLALFFGYVESYSMVAALLPWVLLAGLKIVDGNGGYVPLLLLVVLAVLLHPVMIIFCSGPLLMALVLPRLTKSIQASKLSRVLIGLGVVGLIGLYLMRSANVGGLAYYLLPWTVPAGQGQAIFSYKFLIAAPAPVLRAAFFSRGAEPRSPEAMRRTMYAVWTIVPVVLFVLFFAPHLSGPRDWDLFGMALWVLLPSLMIFGFSRPGERLSWQVMPAVAVGLLVAVSFVAVNASMEGGRDRFVETIEVARYKNLFNEYKTLFAFSEFHPELDDRRLEFAEKAWAQPPYNHEDSLFILNALAKLYLDRNDPRQAYLFVLLGLKTDPLDLDLRLRQIDVVIKYGQPEEQIAVAGEIERLFADNGLALMNAGIIFMRQGLADRGGANLTHAFELDSTNATILLNYGIYQRQIGHFARSAELIERYLRTNRPTFPAEFYAAESLFKLGQTGRARQHLFNATQLAQGSTQQQLVQDLQRQLAGG